MKRRIHAAGVFCAVFCGLFSLQVNAEADSSATIHTGIYIGDMDVSGMTAEQAQDALERHMDELKETEITMNVVGGNQVTVSAGDLGLTYDDENIVSEALALGKDGNILNRYKALKDLEHENKVLDLNLSFDDETLTSVLSEKASQYNVEAQDAHLTRENGSFKIEGGQVGETINIDESKKKLQSLLDQDITKAAAVHLVIDEEKPQGNTEDLEKVKDILGTFTTSFTSSSADRSANVSNGCSLINGLTLYPGDEFSTLNTITPFTEENGYHLAGSYLNGQVVESLGGGICQVSTTLYNAVLRSELEVTERHNHSMAVAYVDPSADAAIAESANKDFRFKNSSDYPIYIEGYTHDKHITFNVYGVETRDAGHKVSFESEVTSVTEPTELVVADASQPVGYVSVESAHVGKTAILWKTTTENGEEVSKEQVNSSTYKMTPKTARVGTATSDPVALSMIQSAIATNSIDNVKGVAAAIKAGATVTQTPVDPATGLPIDPATGQVITPDPNAAAGEQPQEEQNEGTPEQEQPSSDEGVQDNPTTE